MSDPYPPLRRGEVRELADGSRWVLVSADDWQDAGGWPLGLPIVRRRPPSLYVVPLGEADPLSGSVLIGDAEVLDPARLGPPLGMLTGSTLTHVAAGLRALLDL